jgi:transcriptional regulator with XRE-family HTH domain
LVTTTHAILIGTEADDSDRRFGLYLRTLRLERGIASQPALARRCRPPLANDTIRRLEAGSFSPSLDTLRKVCTGLGLSLTALFEGFELGEVDDSRAFAGLAVGRGPLDIAIATGVVRSLFDELDAAREVSPLTVEQPAIAPIPSRAARVLAE